MTEESGIRNMTELYKDGVFNAWQVTRFTGQYKDQEGNWKDFDSIKVAIPRGQTKLKVTPELIAHIKKANAAGPDLLKPKEDGAKK